MAHKLLGNKQTAAGMLCWAPLTPALQHLAFSLSTVSSGLQRHHYAVKSSVTTDPHIVLGACLPRQKHHKSEYAILCWHHARPRRPRIRDVKSCWSCMMDCPIAEQLYDSRGTPATCSCDAPRSCTEQCSLIRSCQSLTTCFLA